MRHLHENPRLEALDKRVRGTGIGRIDAALRALGKRRWMHDTCGVSEFAWQEGYGAFSVGLKQVEATVEYIAGQKEHHRKRDFQAEFVAFLKKHGIEYDPRYVWG